MRERRHETRAREAQVLRLRCEGRSFAEIADRVDVSSPSAAHRIYRRASDAMVRQAGDELRELEGARLDALQATWWARATGGDHRAAQVVLRIMERRAKLYRLDAVEDQRCPTCDEREMEHALAELARVWDASLASRPGADAP